MVEASIVFEARHGADGVRELDLFVAAAAIQVVPVDAEQTLAARDAFRRYGKGRHAAGLNFGDCFSYVLAQVLGEPLLFKGTNFPRTDVAAALPLGRGAICLMTNQSIAALSGGCLEDRDRDVSPVSVRPLHQLHQLVICFAYETRNHHPSRRP